MGPAAPGIISCTAAKVANNALESVAVLGAAVVIATPVAGAPTGSCQNGIGLILLRTIRLLREAAEALVEPTTGRLDSPRCSASTCSRWENVQAVRDLHATRPRPGLPVLTAHLVIDGSCFLDGYDPWMVDQMQAGAAGNVGVAVEHCTVQFEPSSHVDREAGLPA